MKFVYDPETDSLYIELSEKTGFDSVEFIPGIVFDMDENNTPVGIDIEYASRFIDISKLETESLPIESFAIIKPPIEQIRKVA